MVTSRLEGAGETQFIVVLLPDQPLVSATPRLLRKSLGVIWRLYSSFAEPFWLALVSAFLFTQHGDQYRVFKKKKIFL